MIDLHCHILPGIDDGAPNLSESIRMAKKAVEQGVHTIVATPHHMNNQYENRRNSILKRVEELNQALLQEQLNVKIIPGQEVRVYGELVEDFLTGEILPINDSPYVLVEFPSSQVPRYTEKLFYDMQLNGLIPIIVHPERNQEVIEHPNLLYRLVEKGAFTQITAASLCGDFGKKIKQFSQQLIEANLTHFIASDAHNTSNRTCRMREAFDIVQKKYGNEMLYIFQENAEIVLEGGHLYKEVPERIQKKKFFKLF
ncbi:tyrosine-protein phosphatase [Neobacillus massiliamazoniensis]|uniref:Tyrosine-protein phosphatase n=1 Tax=Neobacillus massiliamazoniensis TaxID=1499688 RepID=A0A0U1NQ96_9BACI|nr:CpsB/CapC family capsule biosynthesis tyrosine phosphatase [Neobacillus massiliamazoniensis]CRK80165.1 protein-tyrosine-phosphatase [Neobacillus massiliamazoniensis]